MVWWVLWLALVTVLSYLADGGILPWIQHIRVPVLNASVLSVLLLLTTMGLLNRMQAKKRAGEKERLAARIRDLERRVREQGWGQ